MSYPPPDQPYDPSQYYGYQQQPPYQGQGGYGYQQNTGGMPAQQAPQTGFFGALFDFSFKSFVTSRIIPVLWILWLVGIVVGAIFGVISGFAMMAIEPVGGFFTLIISLLFGAMSVLLSRISMEVLIVLFRISEDLTAIRNRGGM